jgi:hypothetical protein
MRRDESVNAKWYLGGVSLTLIATVVWYAGGTKETSSAFMTPPTQVVSIATDRPAPHAQPQYAKEFQVARAPVADAAVQELLDEADRLTRMARYPEWSQPLDLQGDSLEFAEHEQLQAFSSSADGEIQLRALVEKSSFDAPEPVTVRVRWSGRDAEHSASIAARVTNGKNESVALLGFAREGRAEPSLGPWHVATFTPKAVEGPNGAFTIHIVGVRDGERLKLDLPIVYNRPFARFTGQFRDTFDNGDLAVDAQIAVTQTADFRIDASLYGDAQRQPIASGSAATRTLQPGTHWMRIRFAGLILRDQGIDGPYLLRYVALTASTPNAEARTRAAQNAYVTAPYAAQAFAVEPYNDAERLAQAEDLRGRASRLASERMASNH